MNFEIRRIRNDEYDMVMKLVLDVFMEFEAPDYGAEGVDTFISEVIHSEEYRRNFEEGENMIMAAFDNNKMVGVIGTRGESHLSIVFTHKSYHRQGVATKIMEKVLQEIKTKNPKCIEVTVNSSPYGAPFYHNFGFIDTNEEQITSGIRYIPMKYMY